ncbi:MAG: Na+/H+ antiporter NhaA [Tannerellaceae bacterium]|jgi:NhaA family Na+:H+ antiporter|nr:Na+/H+ antiporter NhaA [Tannerellaceae bacterium]
MIKKKTYPIDRIIFPVQTFIGQEKSSGIVLGLCVAIALFLANSPWAEEYFRFYEHRLGFVFDGRPYLNFTIHHWINDGLMSIFFFVAGLELKRELTGGELADPRRAILPVAAAVGGMVVPALIYLAFNPSGDVRAGWGIPMATDIAFALGVLCLLGPRAPLSLKIFLTALAIVDDLGAVLVIAFFYTSDISVVNLLIGFGFISTMYAGNRLGVRSIFFYAVLGVAGVWTAFLLSGVHATIASVIAAFTIPQDARGDKAAAIPPLQKLEGALHPPAVFIVLPIFALANAGVSFDISAGQIVSSVTAGVAVGLLAGKACGIMGATMLLIKLRISRFPEGMTFRHLLGGSLLASIGFTMSLFITSLAFTTPAHIIEAKVGIFTASILGGFSGYLILSRAATTTATGRLY